MDWLYNDGRHGTGTKEDMAIVQRGTLAQEGIVIAAVDVARDFGADGGAGGLNIDVRVTTRGMWTGEGALHEKLHEKCVQQGAKMPATTRCASSRQLSGWCCR